MKVRFLLASLIICSFFSALYPDTLHVGTAWQYKTPNDAATAVQDGDIVLIDKGSYTDQATNWSANNIKLLGTEKHAHVSAPVVISNQKAIWVIKGDNVVVENIEFSKASVPDKNGAGIRAEGSGLTIRNCWFHDNEDGILGGSGEILIEHTIFEKNGFGDGFSHNLYISQACTKLTFQFCYSHHAKIGHNLKSRAVENYILYNRIMDEDDGTSSYCINLPNGGSSYIIGNLLHQGQNTDNSSLMSYGEEGLSNPGKDCYIVNNTMVNDRSSGTFVNIAGGADSAQLINNLFIGSGTLLSGPGTETTNMTGSSSDLIDKVMFDYRLRHGSEAIDEGTTPGMANGYSLEPEYHYVHPVSYGDRKKQDVIDIGAYEYDSNVPISSKSSGISPKKHLRVSSNYLYIKLLKETPDDVSVVFFDVHGRLVSTISQQIVDNKATAIPLASLDLAAGRYVVKLQIDGRDKYSDQLLLLK